MVTIRNDIESNGNVNRAPDSAASVTDGTKNVNHLANGSRRSTMADIKPKAFNRKCVGLLALVVCVGVCFGVGMLILYGHLVDRMNESASHGTMLHDKNGNPVKPITTTTGTTPTTITTSTAATTTTTTTSSVVTSIPTTEADISTAASTPSIPSTTEMAHQTPTAARPRGGLIFFDSWIPISTEEEKSAEATSQATIAKDKGSSRPTKPTAPAADNESSYGRGMDDDDDDGDDDDDNASGSGSGNNK